MTLSGIYNFQIDAWHRSQGHNFCTLQPLLSHREFIKIESDAYHRSGAIPRYTSNEVKLDTWCPCCTTDKSPSLPITVVANQIGNRVPLLIKLIQRAHPGNVCGLEYHVPARLRQTNGRIHTDILKSRPRMCKRRDTELSCVFVGRETSVHNDDQQQSTLQSCVSRWLTVHPMHLAQRHSVCPCEISQQHVVYCCELWQGHVECRCEISQRHIVCRCEMWQRNLSVIAKFCSNTRWCVLLTFREALFCPCAL